MPGVSPESAAPSATAGRWLVAGQLLLLAALALAGPLDRRPTDALTGRLAAGACLIFAAWTGLSGVRQLGHRLTPMPAPKAGSSLVTTGIYARVRHPLYAATLALALGWMLWWLSPLTLLLTLALAGLLHLKVRFEEASLRRHFPGYADYARRVPRYFPKFRQPPAPSSEP